MQLPAASYLHEKDQKEYAHAATFYTQEHCLYILDYLLHWYKEIHRTPFKRVTLEMIFLHLIRSQKRISLPMLVRRLEEIEGGATPHPIEKKIETPAPKPQPPKVEIAQAPPPPKVEAPVPKPTPAPVAPPKVEPAPVQMEMPAPKPEPAKVEAALPKEEPKPVPPKVEAPVQPVAHTRTQKNRYDTLLRFAAVELEGSIKKDL
jgi:DNA polymerase-3 subunit gamma/tau